MMFVFGTVLAAPLHLATEAVSPSTLSRMGAPPADVLPLDLGPQVGVPWLACSSAPSENRALQEAGEAMSAALLHQRPAEAAVIGDAALAALPCLRAPVEPRLLAGALVLTGMARATLGQAGSAREALARALSVDPGTRWPAVFAGEPGQAEFDALVVGGGLRGRVAVVGAAPPVWVDGVRVPAEGLPVPVGGHLLQVEGQAGAAWIEVRGDTTLAVALPSAWQPDDLEALVGEAGADARRSAALGWAGGDPLWVSLGARHYRVDAEGVERVGPRPQSRVLAAAVGGMAAGWALAGVDLAAQGVLMGRCRAAIDTPDEDSVCGAGQGPFDALRAAQPVFVTVGAAGTVLAGGVWLW